MPFPVLPPTHFHNLLIHLCVEVSLWGLEQEGRCVSVVKDEGSEVGSGH